MIGLSEIINNYSSTHPKKTLTLPLSKIVENSKNDTSIKPIKIKEVKNEEKKRRCRKSK